MTKTNSIIEKKPEPTKWIHYDYDYYETRYDKDYIKIDGQDRVNGYYITLKLNSSSRGVNCYDNEIDAIIEKLTCIKNKIKEIKKGDK